MSDLEYNYKALITLNLEHVQIVILLMLMRTPNFYIYYTQDTTRLCIAIVYRHHSEATVHLYSTNCLDDLILSLGTWL